MRKRGTEDKYTPLIVPVDGDPDDAFSQLPFLLLFEISFFLFLFFSFLSVIYP
jgi:hypothetical protein